MSALHFESHISFVFAMTVTMITTSLRIMAIIMTASLYFRSYHFTAKADLQLKENSRYKSNARKKKNSRLKAVNHPANSGGLQSLKLNNIFCFDFGAAVAKIFNKYKKMSPEKNVWKL